MKAGTFFPDQHATTLFAMAGDDCSLHFDLDALTPRQRADHEANEVLTALLQVALLYIGRRSDHVALFDAFRDPPWHHLLDFHRDAGRRMGLDPVDAHNLHFHPRSDFYASVAGDLPAVDLVNLYMISASNAPLHRSPALLAVSRNVNSKMHFARHAPAAGIPVPETLVTRRGDLVGADVAAFFARHDNAVVLKTLGLAGARNVAMVDSVAAARAAVAEYDDAMEVLLQQRLDTRQWREMTVDLRVSDSDVRIANVREILFADGLWVGNRIGAGVEVRPAHESVLLQVGRYARDQGYSSAEGSNCGVDYFVRGDEIVVTEINARWTGGLFPAEILRRLGAAQSTAVAFFDLVALDAGERFVEFVDTHLHVPGKRAAFSCVPIGFGPYPQDVQGRSFFYVWHMVLGDFDAFKAARAGTLGADGLITAEQITLAP